MEIAALLAIFVFFTVPGLRLAHLRIRRGKGPEGLLAVFFLAFGAAVPLRLYQAARPGVTDDLSKALGLLAISLLLTGLIGLMLFTWRVFRPASRVAQAWVAASAVYLLVTLAALVHLDILLRQTHPVAVAANVWGLTAMGWTFVECLVYHRRLRRQHALGMGDPVVRNRFGLWCIWTGAFVLLPMVAISVKMLLIAQTPDGAETHHASAAMLNAVRVVVFGSGLTAMGSIWLAFFPPAAYQAWIRGSEQVKRQAA